jgi:hypothetical protein
MRNYKNDRNDRIPKIHRHEPIRPMATGAR